ncbi:MAG: extracellular solute-binding protein [Chloroflexi bacterium]|nr:extracellular solute-binding protein [Chloroflexota bacterium]
MNRIAYSFVALVVGLGLVIAACAPAPSAPPAAGAAGQAPAAATGGSLTEWERVVAAAKKEGEAMLYSSSGPAVRDPITKEIREKYGIALEWVAAPNVQLEERIMRERRAGLYNADVYFSGVSGVDLGEQKVLQSLDNALILPEVLDTKVWWGGKMLFIDEGHTWAGILASPTPPIFINTNMVKPEEVRSYKNFLEPKWKGKIVLFNPRTGGGLDWLYHASEVIVGRDFIVALAAQEPIITNDARQQVEWVAQGKYPVGLGGRRENKIEFVKLGAPIKLVLPIEGTSLSSGAGGVGFFDRPPHPNAAKVFINWALSREGGTLISRVIGGQSARLDVPTDFLEPESIRQEGGKYFNTMDKQNALKKQAFQEVAVQIFGHLMR